VVTEDFPRIPLETLFAFGVLGCVVGLGFAVVIRVATKAKVRR